MKENVKLLRNLQLKNKEKEEVMECFGTQK